MRTKNKAKPEELFTKGSFWVGMTVLVLLLILSTTLLLARLYDFAMLDQRSLSLRSNMDAQLDVFSLNYTNTDGEVTVQGAAGEKVIAPGTDVEYTVRLRNTDKFAIDYELSPRAEMHSEYNIPLLVRVVDPDGNYIVGDSKTWVSPEALNGIKETATLAKNASVEYLFQWKWPYESGDDSHDTTLGNDVYKENISLSVSFKVHAEANLAMSDNDGAFGEVYGPTVFIAIFVVLLLIAIGVLIAYKTVKLRPKEKKAAEARIAMETAPIAPKPKKEKKQKEAKPRFHEKPRRVPPHKRVDKRKDGRLELLFNDVEKALMEDQQTGLDDSAESKRKP